MSLPKIVKSIVYAETLLENPSKILKIHQYPLSKIFHKDEQILLKAVAFPINPSDINQLQGVYPSRPVKDLTLGTAEPVAIAGNEGLFEVVSIPDSESHNATTSSIKPGDLVIPLNANFGTWSSYRSCNSLKELIKLNKNVDIFTGATLGVNSCTANMLVNNFIKDWKTSGNDKETDWLVTNAGTSQVAKIVTQICKKRGIKTLSVIRDRENFDQIAEELMVKYGATKVISESQNDDKSFNKEVLPQILQSGKIRLALNSVGGSSATSLARKLPENGIMVTYGGMSKKPVSLPTSLLIFKNIQCLGFWITKLCSTKPDLKIASVQELLPLYKNGDIISPRDDLRILEWDVENQSNEEILELFKNGIELKGKKNIIVLK